MDSLIQTFHLDWKLLLAQFVNFLIVFVVLWLFALKPLLKIMSDRTKKIEAGLKDAKIIEAKLASTDMETKKIFSEAQKKAQGILNMARINAEMKRQELIEKAKLEIERLVLQGKKQIVQEKEKMLADLQAEVLSLSLLATEKVLNQKIDSTSDKKLVAQVVQDLTK